jgi:hypothetical protein
MLPVALVALLARALPQEHAGDVLLVDVQKQAARQRAGVPEVAAAVRDSPPDAFSLLASLPAPFRLAFFHACWSHMRLASSRNHFFSSSGLNLNADSLELALEPARRPTE